MQWYRRTRRGPRPAHRGVCADPAMRRSSSDEHVALRTPFGRNENSGPFRAARSVDSAAEGSVGQRSNDEPARRSVEGHGPDRLDDDRSLIASQWIGLVSADGRWKWDGQRWEPNTPEGTTGDPEAVD